MKLEDIKKFEEEDQERIKYAVKQGWTGIQYMHGEWGDKLFGIPPPHKDGWQSNQYQRLPILPLNVKENYETDRI